MSMSPTIGSMKGGTRIIVNGTGFSSVIENVCIFSSETVNAEFLINGQLACESPPKSGTESLIGLRVGLGNGIRSKSMKQFQYADCTIHSIIPAQGAAEGGTEIHIHGAGFIEKATNMCRINGTNILPATFISAKEVTCTTPPLNGTGRVKIEATINSGHDFNSENIYFEVVDNLLVTSILPMSGPVSGGTVILVKGENFLPNSMLLCKFGEAEVEGRLISDTQVECISPNTSIADASRVVALSLSTNGVDFVSGPDFIFYEEISVSLLTPSMGPIEGGTLARIHGSNFIYSEFLRCKFGSNVAVASFISVEEIACIVPPREQAGNVSLSLSNNGVDFFPSSLTFQYYESVKVHSLWPKHGKASGGTSVTIAGARFENTESLSCMFGIEIVSGSFVSTEEITCVAPALTSSIAYFAAVEISLNGYDFTTDGVLYEYVDDAALLSVSPVSGPTSGGSAVTLTGTNFVGSDTPLCRFGDVTVAGLLLSLSEIECVTPPMSNRGISSSTNSVHVSASTNGVDFTTDSVSFGYYEEITVSSVLPSRGVMSAETVVIIVGTNFLPSDNLRCRFGVFTTEADFVSSTEVTCSVPPSSEGSSDVTVGVSNNGVDFAEDDSVLFSYIEEVKIESVWPQHGSISGGTVVTVTGSGFDEEDSTLSCMFGDEYQV
eukprot:CAMPEP_0116049566 /NCGR_PEP_ID=MMETSP0321-20121206/30235_1 /TAXON_ID=163516 /ORGANISM="Leptocylindrus danicus var. danicus, Strain B650" /LENGTH=663 /DNA_ID=CAMNT_0003532005 /DNA_START=372 /DNA_END=2360 /DNA_ORIENTATION=+